MKRYIYLFLCVIFSISFIGCKDKDNMQGESLKLYYINNDETQIVSEDYQPVAHDTIGLIAELIEALDQSPKNKDYKKAKPDIVSVLSYQYNNYHLVLYFDVAYYTLPKITEILCRATIVQIFCQLDEVEDVEFYVGDLPLTLSSENVVGLMNEDTFIYNSGVTAELTLYFTNKEGNALVPYHIKLNYDRTISKEQLVVKLLIQGPSKDNMDVFKTLPDNTTLLKLNVKDKVCYVDFSSEFLERRPEVTEEVTIYSVVNSLIELSNITKVQFLIDGEQKKVYQSMDLTMLYERNLKLIESEY